jgi:protein-tyrosine phosphatase
MRHLIEQHHLQEQLKVDSAGTGGWHVGESPDARATAAARARGIKLDGHARQVRLRDFEDFDLILAMDNANARELRAIAPDEESAAKIRLLREFDPQAQSLEVPDPYYGGSEGFEHVIDLVQAACIGVLDSLGLSRPATS